MRPYIFLLLSVVMITSCTPETPEPNPMHLPWLDSVTVAEDPGLFIRVPYAGSRIGSGKIIFIKFKKEEYKKYIVAQPYPQGKCYTFRWVQGVNIEKLVGTSPYIDLPKGYVALDWKWLGMGFMYEPYTLLLNKKWKTFKQYDQTWTYEDVYQPEVHELIEEYWEAGYPHLDWYFGNYRIPINPDTRLPANVCLYVTRSFLSFDELAPNDQDYYRQAIKEEEKRFNAYLKMLKKLIETGEYKNECAQSPI